MYPLRIALKSVFRIQLTNLRKLSELAFSKKYLFYTNVGISLSLSSVGDILEQQYEIIDGRIEEWSKRRTCYMGISGLTVGIFCHHWYQFLDAKLPGKTASIVAKKVLLDQIICSPIYLSVFFVTMAVLERKNVQEMLDEMKQKAWKLYAAEWVVWPVAQVINFYWLPTKYRVLYDSTISLGYDVFFSHVKHED